MESVSPEEEFAPPGIFVPWAADSNRSQRVKFRKTTNSDGLLFQPLIICMRFLGIELVPSSMDAGSSSKSDRYKTLTLGLILFVFNGFCNIYSALDSGSAIIRNSSSTMLHSVTNDSTADGTNSTTRISAVMSWNIIIDYVNFGVLVVVVHATLLSFSRQEKWKLLWNNIQRMQQEFEAIHETIQRLTTTGLVFLFSETMILIISVLCIVEIQPGAHGFLPNLFPTLFRLYASFSYIYAGCGLFLFALVGWSTLLGFRFLHEQVVKPSSLTCPSLTANEQLTVLTQWKSLYVLLSDVVDGMNECFGPILLVWIAHMFVAFIATPYYILDGFQGSVNSGPALLTVSIYLMIQHAFHLLIITGIPTGIRQQAISIGKQLQQMNLQDFNHLQEEVHMLATEVLISLPRITAMEYGDLDLSLIPTLIGTMLTYLVILCQFEVAEET